MIQPLSWGKEVALNIISSGHYCIPIDKTEKVQTIEVNAVKLDEMNIKDLKSTMLKLHQFAPPNPKMTGCTAEGR